MLNDLGICSCVEQKYKTIQEAEKKELLFLTKIVRFLAIQIGFYSETFQFRSVIDKDTLLTCNLTDFFSKFI